MESKNELQNKHSKIAIALNKNTSKLSLNDFKNSINSIYSKKNQYNQIIQIELLIKNIENHFDKNKNDTESDIFVKNKKIIKIIRNINYLNKFFYDDKKKFASLKYNYIDKYKLNKNCFIIDNIILIKGCINSKRYSVIKIFFEILFLFQFYEIISINIIELILDIYINIINDLIITNEKNISFLDTLIKGIINFSKINLNKDNKILHFILSLFEESISNNFKLKYKYSKSFIFLKLLKYNNDVKIMNFLSNIYKNNVTTNFLYKEIYKHGILNLNYYINSLYLLSNILGKEYSERNNNSIFKLTKGFFIHKNNPIIPEEKISFKEKESSIIFSFKLLNDNIKDNIIIFSFIDCSIKDKEKSYMSFNLYKNNDNYFIKIIIDNKERVINDISIIKGYDYLICISKSNDSDINMKFTLYINEINNNVSKNKNNISYKQFMMNVSYRNIDELKLKFGETNFEGIIGDFFIIDKKLNDKDISHLLNLNCYYSIIAENLEDKTDLINNYDNLYLNRKESIERFKQMKYKCLFKITADNVNQKYIYKKIETFKLNNTLNIFINSNGIEFLVMQLHNIFTIFDIKDITSDEINKFNLYLYQTINFYYDIILIMNNEGKKKFRLNNNEKFDYFFLSFLIILDQYKKLNKHLKIKINNYNLLINFIHFCQANKYITQRNLILNILLDENLFNQSDMIKQLKIFDNLQFILDSHLNNEIDDLFDNDILYKILNLQFIFESKEYKHRQYMEIILKLITINKQNIVQDIFKYIINIKSEAVLYHYLKIIYKNYEELKSIIESKYVYYLLSDFLRNFLKGKNYCDCAYCYKVSALISLIKDELKIMQDNYDNKNIDNPSCLIRYKICEIKKDFINSFELSKNKRLQFVKFFDNNILNKNNDRGNKDKELKDNSRYTHSSSVILIDQDFIQKINREKFLAKFNSIINNINIIYEIYSQNASKIKNNSIKDYILNTFEILVLFFEEIICNKKYNITAKNVFNDLFDKNNEFKHFLIIYLMLDYTKACTFFKKIIKSSILDIRNPFYLGLLLSDVFIDKESPVNNKKIKDEITKLILTEITNISEYRENININREKLLIIIYQKIIIKKEFISNEEKNLIINFITSLTINDLFQYNYFYLIGGEYYNFFELQIIILFEIYKRNNYNDLDKNTIYELIIPNKNNNETYYYLNDMKLIQNIKSINDNSQNTKDKNENRVYIPNLLYTLYFLIHFISIKNEKGNDHNSNKETFINNIIDIIFNNCLELFQYIVQKKLSKKFNVKTNISKLDIYISFYNHFISRIKKSFSLEEMEIYYKLLFNKSKTKKKEIKKSSNKNINSDEPKGNNEIKINKIKEINSEIDTQYMEEQKDFNLKLLLKEENIPMIYYNKLINKDQDYSLTKALTKPKSEFFWKIFIYPLKDMIFYNKNFIKISNSFKAYTKDKNIEKSSSEEDAYYLNYPTKIKNFISNEYYKPFLKPDIKFFERDEIKISHNYIPYYLIEKIRKQFDFTKIKFIEFFPVDKQQEENQEIICENISYRGNILGNIYLKESFLVFKDDHPTILDKSLKDPLFFIYSFKDISLGLQIQNKLILIYYKEIKEIIIRRFCLKRIGYEFFLKDGRSYLFNFFNIDNFNKFQNIINKKGITIINDPLKQFDKKEYKNKFKKGELSNFQALLILNKYSTRTFNDINQYLVFPLLYINLEKNIKRDLSKAICLNKEEKDLDINKYMENFGFLGCYFNNHYSTSAYVLYYLIRVNPYTYLHIKFQSSQFDVPERIFNDYNGYTYGIIYSSENRELIPELFHFYEICLNLNKNNYGKMNYSNVMINNFNSNKYKTCIEFIINQRISLEKANIVPWINNIFGCNQLNDSKEVMNLFQTSSYEQKLDINLQKIKGETNFEKYLNIRNKLANLDIGITPVQLFKTPHPEKIGINDGNINANEIHKVRSESFSSNSSNNDNNSKKEEKKTKENEYKVSKYLPEIKAFTFKQSAMKYKIFINETTMNIFFILDNKITIYNLINISKGDSIPVPKIKYPVEIWLKNKLINLELNSWDYSRNIIVELMPGFYCICRNDNRTIKFVDYTQKYYYSYLWKSIITAIEPYNSLINTKLSESDYTWNIFFGDEEGFLCILKCLYEYIFNNNEFKLNKIEVAKKIKIHENCINNIIYIQRLGIVISSSLNGDIAINNAESLEILNYIKLGEKYLINNIKISIYDLIYVGCYNYENNNYYIKCYTLNGIKVTKMKSKIKIINFFINDYLNVLYENRTINKCCVYDLKVKEKVDEDLNLNRREFKSDKLVTKFNIEDDNIIHCICCKKFNKKINIDEHNFFNLEKLN